MEQGREGQGQGGKGFSARVGKRGHVVRKLIFSFMIVTFFLIGCAREKVYVRPPRPETVVLPETKKGGTQKPYVVNGERYYPLPETRGFTQQGKASWYGEKFQGRPLPAVKYSICIKRPARTRLSPWVLM